MCTQFNRKSKKGIWVISVVKRTMNLMLINFCFSKSTAHHYKFTIEKQTHNQLSILDLLITNNGDNCLTSVYRKKDSIGLYTI